MSTTYIHFTEEQKAQARQTDLADLLRSKGEKLKRAGREYEWFDGTQKVTIRGNLWFHQYDREGGDAIDFVRRFYRKSYPEAIVSIIFKNIMIISVSLLVSILILLIISLLPIIKIGKQTTSELLKRSE